MTASRADRLAALIAALPYTRFLGMTATLGGEEMTAILPFTPALVGNTVIPALHGGVVAAFMEITALIELALPGPPGRAPRTIDISIDYLRPGRALTTYARADVRRLGRRVASVHVEAWQRDRAAPVAALRGHFLLNLTAARGEAAMDR